MAFGGGKRTDSCTSCLFLDIFRSPRSCSTDALAGHMLGNCTGFLFSWFSRLSPVSWLSGSHSLSSLLRFPSAPGMGPAAKRTRHKVMKGISRTPGQPTRLPVGMSDVLKSGNYLFSPRLIRISSTGGSHPAGAGKLRSTTHLNLGDNHMMSGESLGTSFAFPINHDRNYSCRRIGGFHQQKSEPPPKKHHL